MTGSCLRLSASVSVSSGRRVRRHSRGGARRERVPVSVCAVGTGGRLSFDPVSGYEPSGRRRLDSIAERRHGTGDRQGLIEIADGSTGSRQVAPVCVREPVGGVPVSGRHSRDFDGQAEQVTGSYLRLSAFLCASARQATGSTGDRRHRFKALMRSCARLRGRHRFATGDRRHRRQARANRDRARLDRIAETSTDRRTGSRSCVPVRRNG